MSVVDSTVTISMNVEVREDGKVVLGSYRDIYGHESYLGDGWWGQSLYQLRGSPVKGITYSVSENTQVFVSNDQVDVEIVATMHHELRHVFLTDFGKHFPSGKGHHAHEETSNAEKEARKNFRKQ